MSAPCYPLLYQINTRVWLTELSQKLGRSATLDDIPDAELDRLAEMGFDWVWFLSVWQTGPVRSKSRARMPSGAASSRRHCRTCAKTTSPGPVSRSPPIKVHQNLGGDAALARLRERLRKRGLRLMLDFVPNHMGLDHPWVEEHPEHFITGTELDLARAPKNYTWVKRKGGDLLLAYGRDPYFAGWPDTLQLNYANLATQEAMIGELEQDRRAVRRRALRHGHAGLAGRVRADMGTACTPLLAEGDPARARSVFLVSSSWQRFTGTWNGRSNSRASTTPTTSGYTIAFETSTLGRSASISTRAWTTRTSWPASSRITMSHVPRRRFLRESTKRRR